MTQSLPVCLALTCLAFAQPQAREFEAASLKPSAPARNGPMGCHGGPGSDEPTRLTCSQISLLSPIATAYGVRPFQVKAPNWLAGDLFDVAALIPPGTTEDQVPAMWQKLLTSRFHLATHREERETTVFDLVVAKGGPKLIPAAQAASLRPPTPRAVPLVHHVFMQKASMDLLASVLASELQHPVRNLTGLKDEYVIRLGWNPVNAAPDSGPTLEEAVDEQLGLRLEARKGAMTLIIVDHIDRTPTAN